MKLSLQETISDEFINIYIFNFNAFLTYLIFKKIIIKIVKLSLEEMIFVVLFLIFKNQIFFIIVLKKIKKIKQKSSLEDTILIFLFFYFYLFTFPNLLSHLSLINDNLSLWRRESTVHHDRSIPLSPSPLLCSGLRSDLRAILCFSQSLSLHHTNSGTLFEPFSNFNFNFNC